MSSRPWCWAVFSIVTPGPNPIEAYTQSHNCFYFINRRLGFFPQAYVGLLYHCFSFCGGQAALLNYGDIDSWKNNHWRVLRKWKLDWRVVLLWLIKRSMLWKQGSEWSCSCPSSILFPRLSLWMSGSSHTGLSGALNVPPILCHRTWHLLPSTGNALPHWSVSLAPSLPSDINMSLSSRTSLAMHP